jgi:GntR family transcriptional regulator/MocR family aminotransferase
MQGLGRDRVVYLDTFSKVLAPSLRLGYIVAPDSLIKAFSGARALVGRGSLTTEQHVIAAYMKEGYFEGYIRRIRSIYTERRRILIEALQAKLPWLQIQLADQGMHIVVMLPDGVDDVAVATVASQTGSSLRALSPMSSGRLPLTGLMLGFGGFTAETLRGAVRQLGELLAGMSIKPDNLHD